MPFASEREAMEAANARLRSQRDMLKECMQLIQGQNWQLQDDEFGREIKRRCLIAIEYP